MTGSIAAVVFLTLIACLVLTVPIGFSLGIASLGYILYTKQLTFGFIAQNMVTGCDSFPTMAIPFFIFAGELMGGGGISKRRILWQNPGRSGNRNRCCMYVLRGNFRLRPGNCCGGRRYGYPYHAGKGL